jgi:phenylalanyl-tRNA synthetase beta subunit
VSVLASASDKNFLRTNLTDGLKESIKLNQADAPLLGTEEVKIFEIGTVFKKNKEEMHIAYGDKKGIKEMNLDDFCKVSQDFPVKNLSAFALGDIGQGTHGAKNSLLGNQKFKMWSLFPFIARDVAVWVPEEVKSEKVAKIIKDNMGDMVVRGPKLFDEFKKPASPAGGDGKVSYAFRLVFQSYKRTLTDAEVNKIMTEITNKIKENNGWQVR